MKVFIVPSLKRKADSPVAKLPSAPGMNVELTMNMFFFERAARVFLEKLAEAIEWCCILLVGFVGVRRSTGISKADDSDFRKQLFIYFFQ